MIPEVQTGNAKLYGVTNSGTAFTISGFASFVMQTAKLDHKFEMQTDKDNNNNDNTLIGTNPMVDCTLEFYPSGATRATAAAVAAFITPFTQVVLTNFQLEALNGTWIYVGNMTINLEFAASAKISLPVRQYVNSIQNTSLSTLVVG